MKGVSSILVSVILVGVSIAVVGVYSEWAPGFAEHITQLTADDIESDMQCRNADFRLESVEYSDSAGRIYINMVNTGTITFHQDLTVYAMNSSSIIGEHELERLEVDDSINTDFSTDYVEPDTVIVSSSECPDLNVERSKIELV